MASKANETSPARWKAAYNVLVTLKYLRKIRNANVNNFDKYNFGFCIDFSPWDKFFFFFFQNILQGI
jgi:hypothetical protein